MVKADKSNVWVMVLKRITKISRGLAANASAGFKRIRPFLPTSPKLIDTSTKQFLVKLMHIDANPQILQQ